MSNSGVPYPVRATGDSVAQIESTGVPLGSFYGTTYDEVVLPIGKDDVFVFCSDGVSEAMNRKGEEFTSETGEFVQFQPAAREIVDNLVQAVDNHRAGFAPNDDTTVVVVRIA